MLFVSGVGVADTTSHEHGTTWVLMADPEGNEFCICDGGNPTGRNAADNQGSSL